MSCRPPVPVSKPAKVLQIFFVEYTLDRIFVVTNILGMNLIKVYQCFCDETRLRIFNLLLEGPLCVCHLTEILGVPQPKVSRHLKALRDAGALETERCYNWTIYHLPETPNPVLEANLKCLQDVLAEERIFQTDLKKRTRIVKRIAFGSGSDLPEQIRLLARTCC